MSLLLSPSSFSICFLFSHSSFKRSSVIPTWDPWLTTSRLGMRCGRFNTHLYHAAGAIFSNSFCFCFLLRFTNHQYTVSFFKSINLASNSICSNEGCWHMWLKYPSKKSTFCLLSHIRFAFPFAEIPCTSRIHRHVHTLDTRKPCCQLTVTSSNDVIHVRLSFLSDPHYSGVSCHVVRSSITVQTPSFGYSNQTHVLWRVVKWLSQCLPMSVVLNRNHLPQNHKPICHCHPRQLQSPSIKCWNRFPWHDGANSRHSIVRRPKSKDFAKGWDYMSSVSSCPNGAIWEEGLYHNYQNTRGNSLSRAEPPNEFPDDSEEPCWPHRLRS